LLADLQGREAAVQLYRHLDAGYLPRQLAIASPDGQPVHLDTMLDCASWSAADVPYTQLSTFVVGPPLLATAAMVHTEIANRRMRQQAADAARPQWRPHGVRRFLVTSTATWCASGDWRCYPHTTVTGYEAAAEVAMVWMRDTAPLRLAGPAVWCHAVLVAYGLYGSDRWRHTPWLEPVRHAAARSG
jgi:hypothetical protein